MTVLTGCGWTKLHLWAAQTSPEPETPPASSLPPSAGGSCDRDHLPVVDNVNEMSAHVACHILFLLVPHTSQHSVTMQKKSPSRKLSWNLTIAGWSSCKIGQRRGKGMRQEAWSEGNNRRVVCPTWARRVASLTASTVSSGCISPTLIFFRTFL